MTVTIDPAPRTAVASIARCVRGATVLGLVAVLAFMPRESVEGATDRDDAPVRTGTVSADDVLLVVNDDGSATVSASLHNPTRGFVVPHGVQLGSAATVRFERDHGRSFTAAASVVRRTSAHDLIFPVDGTQLGPARP